MKPRPLFIIIALALGITACAPPPPAENPLSGKWFFAIGREKDTPDDAARYVYRPLPSLAGLDLHHPDRRGVLWLKTGFTVPPALREKQLSLILGFINPCDITYVNGNEIGRSGIAPWGNSHFFSDWNSYRRYDISPAALHEGENILLVKFYANYEGSIGGRILLGEREIISRIGAAESFFRTDINAVIAAIMFIIGLYHLLIYSRRPKDRENLYYSLLCIFFALYQTNFFITRIPVGIQYAVPYIAHQKLILVSLYASGLFGVLFINAYLRLSAPRPLVASVLVFFGAAALAVAAAPDYRLISLYSKMVNAAVALVTMIYVLAALIVMMVKKSRPARVMMLGITPFAACIAFDVITHNLLMLDNYIYLSGFGFSAFLIAIMFILANDFVTYHNEVEVLNVTLDQKVEERTAELLKAKQETEKAMAEIEKAHANQKTLNRELAQAHDTMKRDMDLAANVQSSFYPRRPPETKGWDIAFEFRPMSGVSGDLYDFFLAGDDLYGVSLFDVSGHGVSSGLITMLVKSVLHRNFMRGRELTLNQLLQRMNRELIQEMGSIDNYLTGILLRFSGDKAEYVNAGHTDLVMKNGKTGEARIVTTGNEKFRGHFLGVDSMDELFAMLRFSVREGDSLLLYTDCLIEARNKGGEQYGIERLLRAFTAVDARQSAREQLDRLMADLHRHAGSHALGDDLTAIILKKSV